MPDAKSMIQAAFSIVSDAQRAQEEKMRQVFVGRKVQIVSAYNGQPYGRSKRVLTGRVFEIESVSLRWEHPSLTLKGQRIPVHLDDVEFLDAA